ncbi:5-formyltetrahydrofolate cyclo-ligase [Anaeromicropila herbilytica]|uniref:5-formyltetrahydrofolate cyclo-ligase n=1 Tax=Anaeromicropila herbilytica TaxID=2785025 RepID=A0A7R7EKX4_9FIRM|nr:5-formyltetrahydrofolate cyclo-ligase [Anaeromicropila herbilytica]BCN30590.1 5-formyltetrahydrofolate cyclo-ligase [Anaeromicropila herbilytica]
MTKKEIRQQIKSIKEKLSLSEIEEYSDMITHKFLSSKEYQNSRVIYIYLSFNQEVLTDQIIERALKDQKKVAVPRIDDITDENPILEHWNKKKIMNFYYINSKDDLKKGYYGIMEPTNDQLATDENVLVIMPGLAFDNDFYRIGYGGGFYDYFLNSRNSAKMNDTKIALAFDFQILEKFEHSEYDVKVDQIITPTTHMIRED